MTRVDGCAALFRIVTLTIGFVAPMSFATAAEARLISAQLSAPNDSNHEAVHLPTGCKARVVLDHEDFIGASITDPECLPKGVNARGIPGTRKDFQLLIPGL